MAQQLIAGPETGIESYHVYVDTKFNIVGEFTGRKIRTIPASYGHSTSVMITRQSDVTAIGRDIVKKLKLTGVAKLDLKRGPDGKLYLPEVNPRFNLWHHPGAVAGVNMPALAYADLLGFRKPSLTPARAGVRWCLPSLRSSNVRRQRAFCLGGIQRPGGCGDSVLS